MTPLEISREIKYCVCLNWTIHKNGMFIHSPCCQSEPVCKRLIKNRLNMYRGNAKRQRFADGRSFWYLFAFRVGVND